MTDGSTLLTIAMVVVMAVMDETLATIMRLELRVQFEDGATTGVERKLKSTDYGGPALSECDIVPMRYDPKDRSQIEIDKAAMKARRQEELAREAVQVGDLAKLQGAHKRGEISDEAFTNGAERLLDL